MRIRNVKNKEEIMENSKYYLKDAQKYQGSFSNLFGNSHPIYIEIGMGKGKFLIENAKSHPEINYIGIEKQKSIVAKALKKASLEQLPNLYIISENAQNIDLIFKGEISRIYLNFSDPWPKVRHHSRRLTSKIFLDKYDSILTEDAKIYMRTDNEDLFSYSIESLSQHHYILEKVDLHFSEEKIITTEYEDKFRSEQIPIKALIAKRQSNQ